DPKARPAPRQRFAAGPATERSDGPQADARHPDRRHPAGNGGRTTPGPPADRPPQPRAGGTAGGPETGPARTADVGRRSAAVTGSNPPAGRERRWKNVVRTFARNLPWRYRQARFWSQTAQPGLRFSLALI